MTTEQERRDAHIARLVASATSQADQLQALFAPLVAAAQAASDSFKKSLPARPPIAGRVPQPPLTTGLPLRPYDPDEATDMTRAQRIRAEAIVAATYVLGGDVTGTAAGLSAHLVELAGPIADWIRDGSQP
jgi:hypothetical protein